MPRPDVSAFKVELVKGARRSPGTRLLSFMSADVAGVGVDDGVVVMAWTGQPPDDVILDALEHDLAQWHAAQAQETRDIRDLRRIADRLAQRRVEADQLDDADKYLQACADLEAVEQAVRDVIMGKNPQC